MRRTGNVVRLFVHLNWSTKGRERVLDGRSEVLIEDVIRAKSKELGFSLVAVGGTSDHVHLLISIPAWLSVSKIMKHVKGRSSFLINRERHAVNPDARPFRWQNGYAVFSVSDGAVEHVKMYVQRQKEHHASGQLKHELEVSGEDES